ncbi:MAG: lytic murein transglycosylase [Desulfovibrionaceae bacterium]|nr:lytic murein transglycosylase [Desulfovibrionaceae bacterium]
MSRASWFRLLLVLPVCLMMGSCSRAEQGAPAGLLMTEVSGPEPDAPELLELSENLAVAEVWKPVLDRLRRDGLDSQEITYLFARLGDSPLPDPMGRKVQELYTGKFFPRPKSAASKGGAPSAGGIPRPWYKGVVTDANARRCRGFINTHLEAFKAAERNYGVPTEVAAALLFVETRLGDYLGEQNAFVTLASMAASRSPDTISDWLLRLPDVEKRMDWVSARMKDKADWAYAELRALLEYSVANGVDPFEIPGSSYGAVGLCQFMPSNLPRYAVDGDGDGIVDLFDPADAVASLSNYLARHGWKRNLNVAGQIAVLRRYNNLAIYANTILALAEKIREVPGRPSVNRPLPKASRRQSLAAERGKSGAMISRN